MIKPDTKPWDQREGEPIMWYYRFRSHYLPLEPDGRTLQKAYLSVRAGSKGRLKSAKATMAWNHAARDWEWKKRALAYDNRIQVAVEKASDETTETMVARHLAGLRSVFKKAVQYLGEHDFENMNDARLALKLAIDEERKALGLPSYLMGITRLSDGELLARYREVIEELGRARSGNDQERDITAAIIDAEFTESGPETDANY